ncbi:PP2C family protein-serine/threonine phosphatase [Streptomyces albus]|uniref:PP2C family protein-serine/threonine phosphatase n=1 Tax=Streptomyces sp. NRRL F-5639 TaxID=1463867 RepID=UPI0004C67D91|nr:PP2C family protein-serine/threonine phosphatase [Streptomyces sp. NRRL F-5639]
MSLDDRATTDHGVRPEEHFPESATERSAMLGALISASHFSTLEQLPERLNEEAARVGLTDITVYLVDLQQDLFTPLVPHPPPAGGTGLRHGEFRVEGTVAGRAFQHGEVLPAGPGDHDHWWVPLVDGTDRLGVMRITAPDADEAAQLDMRRLAALVALMIVSKRGLSDSYSRLVRRRRMDVATEMEWRLMPSRTFATDSLMISALMEPAYQVSGDVYDYAFDGRIAQLSLFDAMGHDTAAGVTANLALSTARNARREGSDLASTAAAVEEVLVEQFSGDRFVTGILAELDVATGELDWLNCGHPQPVVVRGRSPVHLDGPTAPPIGPGLGHPDTLCHKQLEPGDRLLLYTDGVTEARNPEGEEFGLQRFIDFLLRHQADELPVPETLRRLIRHHLDYHKGQLRDDATVVLAEWHGAAGLPEEETKDKVGIPDMPETQPAEE